MTLSAIFTFSDLILELVSSGVTSFFLQVSIDYENKRPTIKEVVRVGAKEDNKFADATKKVKIFDQLSTFDEEKLKELKGFYNARSIN